MRKLPLFTALTLILVSGSTAHAGTTDVIGLVAPLVSSDPFPELRATSRKSQVSVDGRVPVRLNTVVNGELQTAAQGTVTFVRNGQMAQQASVLDGGTVQAEGLEVGSYSVFVHGADGFAAFSTWLAPSSPEADLVNDVISVGLVPLGDSPVVHRIIQDHRLASQHVPPTTAEPTLPVARRTTDHFRKLVFGSVIQLGSDGTLRGRVVRDPDPERAVPFRGAAVYFVRSNSVVGQAVTDEEGLFELPSFSTGTFSLVVAGEGAFLALSVEVVPTPPSVAQESVVNELTLVSLQGEPPVSEISPVFPGDVIVVEEYWLVDEDPTDEGGYAGSGGMGSGGGGFAGGGGYAGGGGGLAEAIIAGAIIGGAFIIADDDNKRFISNPNP